MFSQQILTNYTTQIDSIATQITALEVQLNELREQQKALEAERQALSTLAGAGESAIDQARSFLTLASRAGREDMVEAFWDEMDSLRTQGDSLTLPPLSPSVEEEDQEASPDPDGGNDIPTIDLEGDLSSFGSDSQPAMEVADQPDLATLSIGKLRTLCKEHGLSIKGSKAQLRDRLLSITSLIV